MCHGNSESINSFRNYADLFAKTTNTNILVFEYPGYSYNNSEANESETYLAADMAYNWLKDTKHVDANDIIVYGRSLGAAVAIYIGKEHKVSSVVAEAGFTSAFRVITRYSVLFYDMFPSLERIEKYNTPVLFIHGKKDTTIPYWHSQKLHQTLMDNNIKTQLSLCDTTGHTNTYKLEPKHTGRPSITG